LQVAFDHFGDELGERRLVPPAKLELLDLRGPDIALVDPYQVFARLGFDSNLVFPLATSCYFAPDAGKRTLYELAHRVRFAGGQHIIVSPCLLKH